MPLTPQEGGTDRYYTAAAVDKVRTHDIDGQHLTKNNSHTQKRIERRRRISYLARDKSGKERNKRTAAPEYFAYYSSRRAAQLSSSSFSSCRFFCLSFIFVKYLKFTARFVSLFFIYSSPQSANRKKNKIYYIIITIKHFLFI